MNNFDQLKKAVDFIVNNDLPRETVQFYDNKRLQEMGSFFKTLGSNGMLLMRVGDTTKTPCMTLSYAGVTFHFISTENDNDY